MASNGSGTAFSLRRFSLHRASPATEVDAISAVPILRPRKLQGVLTVEVIQTQRVLPDCEARNSKTAESTS